jgi:anti-anti-sigma factor
MPFPVTPAHSPPVVVIFPAEIDMANASQIRQRLHAVLDAGAAVVAAGMTAIRFCDSQGIGSVVLAHKRATAGGAELRVVIPSKPSCRSWTSRG